MVSDRGNRRGGSSGGLPAAPARPGVPLAHDTLPEIDTDHHSGGQSAVRGMLALAIGDQRRVAVRMHSSTGRADRELEGVPTEIIRGPDGRDRVFLEVVPGETTQVLLLERIATVKIAG